MTRFNTTRWSLILEARQPETARTALEQICGAYRGPVLAYVCRHGYSKDDAEDLTQDFFARLLERRWDTVVDPARGRFRSFLLTALQRFLIDARHSTGAQKRGGGQRQATMDPCTDVAAPDNDSPEQAFDRAWALTVLDRSYLRLRDEAQRAGKRELFDRLEAYIAEPADSADYTRLSQELGVRANTIAVSVHRLRVRLRELVREELADTTGSEADLMEELHVLRSVLGGADH